MSDHRANDWSERFGLAVVPLFERNDESAPPGEHQVLLDGGFGTFALSNTTEELWRDGSPAAWAWSSDVPHHVTVTDAKVAVLRWDKPAEPRVFDRSGVERGIDRFYQYLNDDRLRSNRGVVDHMLGYFRRIRALGSEAGLPDERTTDLFTGALARLIAPDAAAAQPEAFGLAEDALSLCARLNSRGFLAATEEIASSQGTVSLLQLHPALAIRHAGGQLFQEAHFELLRASPNFDLFGLMDAPEVRVSSRGGTHFTPPTLARSVVEQALAAIPDIDRRAELVLCDPACGSGAFLHEALRALRRARFDGRLRVVGYDISAAAISMARFVLASSVRDWSPKGGVELDLRVGDSLGDLGMPKADVIVMNPPFVAFGAQTALQREQLRSATDASSSRGDFSMAFVTKALEALTAGGVLGTLFPASLLSLKAATSWRERLAHAGDIRLLASIGDFGLFAHAIVQVACAVVRKSETNEASELTAVVTEDDPSATSAALRQLRKLHGVTPLNSIAEEGWSLFPVRASSLHERATWRLPTPSSERVLRSLSDLMLPTVGDLFDVAQGIQTGLNDAFLLREDEWSRLPPKERAHFRLATMTDSITSGRVEKPYRLFFPHTATGPLFEDEAAVAKAVPTYFKKYLEPNRDRLAARASIVRAGRTDWWGLMHPRTWAFDLGPRIITKFFAAEGGFAGDYDAQFLPVMGHVWRPGRALVEGANTSDREADGLTIAEVLSAYVAVLNSTPFIRLLALFAPHVAGGQFDVSSRHVGAVPMPNLRELSVDPRNGRIVGQLSALGRAINLADPLWQAKATNLVVGLYGPAVLEGL